MLHKFEAVNTGTVFYFDNVTNALYNGKRERLSMTLGNRENRQAPNPVHKGGVTKSSAPTEIKVVFGHKCNYSCSYCVQKDMGDHAEEKMKSADVKTRAEKLIQSMKENLDLSSLEQMELWGGEIFLYWDDVKEVIRAFDRPGFDWVIPTNGTLLTKKHIEHFASLQGRVTLEISHDGPVHEKVRGPDFLQRKADVFRMIEDNPEKVRATLNIVVSRDNFDFFAINEYFRAYFAEQNLKPWPLTFLPLIVYKENSKMSAFHAEIEDYRKSLDAFLDSHIQQMKATGGVRDAELLQTTLFHINGYGDDNYGVLQLAARMRSELDQLESSICGMHQTNKLVVDINGNIKPCQNARAAQSTINISQFNETKKEFVIAEMTPTPLRDVCKKCPVRLQCLGGCLLNISDESFALNCELSKAHNMTMLLSAFKVIFNSPVRWHGLAEN